jgi:hypothetical protein
MIPVQTDPPHVSKGIANDRHDAGDTEC